MAVTNPCGLSVQQTLDIIKNNVVTGNYNGRNEMMKGLMNDPALNLSFSEAQQVTDYYYSIYRKLAAQNKSKPAIVPLTKEQRTQRQVNNLAIDYLSGNTGGFPLSDADIKEVERLYGLADKADTPTLKAKYDEQANVFIAKHLPTYSNELFRSSVYARPLLSAVFFIKSLTSNFHAQIERAISNTLWDGRKADFRFLTEFDKLANASFSNVIGGGIPATTIAHNEQFDFSKGRLEEFRTEGTPINDSKLKYGYFNLMRFYTKWSNRLNAAPDTRGIYSNAERHMYQLLKEKYRDLYEANEITPGMTKDEIKKIKAKINLVATEKAIEDMELDDIQVATDLATSKFTELGLPINNSRGKQTAEFKVAVQEYQRLNRDHVIWGKALELSKNDFWKKNMTVKSELGFGDYGVFGLQSQIFSSIKNKLETKTKSKLSSAFQLYAFGFLNGAANFAEDAIERFPVYAAVKVAALQYKKGKVSDVELSHDIARRQKDLVVKNITTATFFLAARMIEKLICEDRQDKVSGGEISEGRTQLGPCGIPVIVPPQMMPMYKVYEILVQANLNDQEYFDTVLNVLPVLVQSNEMGLGGTISKIGVGATEYAKAVRAGNNVRGEELKAKLVKDVVRGGVDLGNSFIPLPSRLLNEGGTLVQRIEGQTQRQQDLNIAINETGNPKEWYNSLGKVGIASLGNVTGVNEIIVAAIGSDKPYAMDWQGRKIIQLRGSDITGSGIQYNANDELLIDAGVRPPYITRTEKVIYETTKENVVTFRNNEAIRKTNKVRYLTDEEYFNVSDALGNFNAEYFEKNKGKIYRVINKDQPAAKAEIEAVFRATKKTAIKAVQNGIKSPRKILRFVKDNWETTRDQEITETSY